PRPARRPPWRSRRGSWCGPRPSGRQRRRHRRRAREKRWDLAWDFGLGETSLFLRVAARQKCPRRELPVSGRLLLATFFNNRFLRAEAMAVVVELGVFGRYALVGGESSLHLGDRSAIQFQHGNTLDFLRVQLLDDGREGLGELRFIELGIRQRG